MGTAEKILNTAVELFSTRGADAVGIREIAKKSGVLPNTITHHFGNKENLTLKVLQHALEHNLPMAEILNRHIAVLPSTPQEKAQAVAGIITDIFIAINNASFDNAARLISRSILGTSREQKMALMESFSLVEKDFIAFLEKIGISFNPHQFLFFTYYFWGQSLFQSCSKDIIAMDLGVDEMPPEAIEAFAAESGRVACLILGLPDPTISTL